MRKRWIVASVLVGLLAAGLAGGAVLAQSGGGKSVVMTIDLDSDSHKAEYAARVASILGIDAEQVEAALEQAAMELKEERLDKKLDSIVEKGLLTQEEADAIQAWLALRPEGAFMPFKEYGGWGRSFSGKGFHGFGGQWSAEWLEKLHENGGKLTQEEAEAYQAWLDARPEVDIPALERYGERDNGFLVKGFHGSGGQWAAGWLTKLVEEGLLTQEEADAYLAWLDDMPGTDFPAFEGFGAWGDGFRGKDHHGFGDKR